MKTPKMAKKANKHQYVNNSVCCKCEKFTCNLEYQQERNGKRNFVILRTPNLYKGSDTLTMNDKAILDYPLRISPDTKVCCNGVVKEVNIVCPKGATENIVVVHNYTDERRD